MSDFLMNMFNEFDIVAVKIVLSIRSWIICQEYP